MTVRNSELLDKPGKSVGSDSDESAVPDTVDCRQRSIAHGHLGSTSSANSSAALAPFDPSRSARLEDLEYFIAVLGNFGGAHAADFGELGDVFGGFNGDEL